MRLPYPKPDGFNNTKADANLFAGDNVTRMTADRFRLGSSSRLVCFGFSGRIDDSRISSSVAFRAVLRAKEAAARFQFSLESLSQCSAIR
jgi:hypothetical protein